MNLTTPDESAPLRHRTGIRTTRGELSTILVSQAVSSGGNFVAALFAAHESGPGRYGPIAILFAFYAAAVQLTRPFAGNVLQIRVLHRGGSEQRMARGIVVVAFAAGGVITAAFLPFGFHLFGEAQRNQLLMAASLVPLLVVYDTLRLWSISVQLPRRALAMDTTWLVIQVIGMIVLRADGRHSGAAIVLVWAASGAAVAVVAWCSTAFVGPRETGIRAALTASRRIGPVYALDATSAVVANTGFVLLLTAVAPVSAIGRLQVLEMPFGVLATASQGLALFLQPTTRRLAAAGREERAWRTLAVSLSLIVLAAIALGVIELALPAHLLRQVFGPSFRPSVALVVAIVIKYVSFGPTAAQSTMSRSLGLRRETLPFAVGFTFVLAALGAISGIYSLPLAYCVLYAGISAGSLEIVRRIRRHPYTDHTV